MIAPSQAQLRAISSNALQPALVEALANGGELFSAAGLTTPKRLMQFIAQVCAETWGLSRLREDLIFASPEDIRLTFGHGLFPTIHSAASFVGQPEALAEFVYGGRLENNEVGDGWRYRGGGLIRLVGRGNYRAVGALSDLPLEDNPELIEHPEAALRGALSYWQALQINDWADLDDLLAVSRAVDRGSALKSNLPNRMNERITYWRRARAVFEIEDSSPNDELALGDEGPMVSALQQDLLSLDYLLGPVDGDFGPRTHRAVQLFEHEHDLVVDGVFNESDWNVLDDAKHRRIYAAEARADAIDIDLRPSAEIAPSQPVRPHGLPKETPIESIDGFKP